MEAALQAAAGLIDALSEPSSPPSLPFALDSLHIISPCSHEMLAWTGSPPDSSLDNKVSKLVRDLCNEQGDICIQMRGLSCEPTVPDVYQEINSSSPVAQPVKVESVDSDVLPLVTATLKTLLANELQMRESDIGENVQFIDLGLD